jgi:hypothetical protein
MKYKKISKLKYTAFLLIVTLCIMSLAALHTSCKKAPIYAAEGAVLTLTSDKTVLKTGGDRARLTVMGFSGGGEALHDHTTVVFSATYGRVEPAEVELMGGIAAVDFISGESSGVAEIRARSGAITADPDPLQIIIGSAALETLSISSSPSSFGPGGGRAHIRAYAFDITGNLLAAIPLVLSSTSGVFENNPGVYYTDDEGKIEDFLNLTQSATVSVASGDITAEVEITVEEQEENQLPQANFSYSPVSPKKGDTVYFNGSLSSDTDGYVVSWQWDFGDGKTASGERVTHVFNWEGMENQSFNVVLKVTDDRGGSAVTSQTVTIQPGTQ